VAQLASIAIWIVWMFLAVLGALILFRLTNGAINTSGLLRDKGPDKAISPVRVQLLLATLAGAGSYLSSVAVAVAVGNGRLPEVSGEMLAVLGASHVLYLGGKSYLKFFVGRLPRV
jgi:hypothetical protein